MFVAEASHSAHRRGGDCADVVVVDASEALLASMVVALATPKTLTRPTDEAATAPML
uniref:Uncharacterized protein n=1 Tax=Phytophthora fragariae TaxID=53985 RepID=A0A6A3DHH2_9STRA|nr:hypothetical protein PF009_g30540 [Phytophthora fragariae]